MKNNEIITASCIQKFSMHVAMNDLLTNNGLNEKKISLVERNQDFKGQSIYDELRNYPKTYFSG